MTFNDAEYERCPIGEGYANGLLMKHGSHLAPWQQSMFLELVEGLDVNLLRGRGRRAGWTVLLQAVEAALKDHTSTYSWDESLNPEDQ